MKWFIYILISLDLKEISFFKSDLKIQEISYETLILNLDFILGVLSMFLT
jgi:hypothetical protein